MAAIISALPMQVLFPSPHLGTLPRNTKITWDTGANSIRGRVFLSLNGGSEEVFDGTARRSGTKDRGVQFGQVLEFRLRRDDPANTLLATVTVTTEKTAGLPAVVLETNELAGGYAQSIFNLTVTPGIDTVTITFRTRQPMNPFVEIVNQNSGAPVYVWQKPDKKQIHKMDMASESPGNRLAQNTPHSYRIVASAMFGSPNTSAAISTGTFRTGARTAEIFFDKIHVRNDGDPGLNGAGEFGFTFGAGDVLTGVLLGNVETWGEGAIDAGQDVAVNRTITIPNAPRGLWVQVKATENDTYFVPLPGAGLCTVGTLPSFASPGSSGGDTGNCAFATVTAHFDISQTFGGTSERPFEMTTGNFAIAYDVFGRLRVEAQAGEWSQAFVESMRPLPFLQTVGAVAWVSPNKNVTFIQKQGRAQRLIMSPSGGLYHALGETDGSWADLGGRFQGAVTAVATAPDRVLLFGLSPEGAVLYKPHYSNARLGHEWQTLGGAFIGRVVATTGAQDMIELFGRAGDGSVSHLTIDERAQPQTEWEVVGSGIADSMAALFSLRAGLSVFALTRKGETLYKRRPPGEDWRPADRKWESLGVASDGLLSAEWVGEDALLLAVVAQDETVRVLTWPSYPDMPPPRDGWQIVGTVNSLLQGRIPESEMPRDS